MENEFASRTIISLIAELDTCHDINQLGTLVPQYLDQLGVAFGGVCLLDESQGELVDRGLLIRVSDSFDLEALNKFLKIFSVQFDPNGVGFNIADRSWEKVYRRGLTLLAGEFETGFELPDIYRVPLADVFREFLLDAGLSGLLAQVSPQNILDALRIEQFLLNPFSSNEGISGALAVYGSRDRPIKVEHYKSILDFSRIVGLAYSRLLKERRLERELENIKASKEKFQAILSIPHFLSLLVDAEGKILEASFNTVQYLNRPPQEVIGSSLFDLSTEILPRWEKEKFEQAINGREIVSYQSSNSDRYYDNVIHPIPDENGNITRLAVFLTDVTDRINSYHKLQQSEEKFRALFESARDAIFIADAESGEILEVNESACELMGSEADQLIGLHQRDLHPREEVEYYEQLFDNHRNRSRSLTEDVYIKKFDGSRVPVDINASPFIVGDRRYLQGTFRDISEIVQARRQLQEAHDKLEERVHERTIELERAYEKLQQENDERRKAESLLREERDFIAAVLDVTGSLVVVLDREARIVRFNKSCEKLTGYTFAELKGKKLWKALILPQERESLENVFRKLLDGDFPSYVQNDWLTKDGKRKLISWSNSFLRDEHGQVKYVIANGIDLTDLSRAEKALAESEKKYRSMIEQSADCIMLIDYHSGKILDVNHAVREMLGYNTAEVELTQLSQIIDNWNEEFAARIEQAVLEKIPVLEEKTCLRKDGGRIEMEVKISPIAFSDKKVLLLSARDITERKKAEAAVRESEREYRTMINAIDDIIHVVDRDLKIIIANNAAKAWYELSGIDPNVEGKSLFEAFDFLPPAIGDEYRQVFQDGEILITEEETLLEKRRIVTETRKIPILENGRVDRIATVMADITARKNSEDELLAAYEELRELDELKNNFISNISHELRTPLVAVKGYTELMLRKRVSDDQYYPWLGIVHRSSKQLEEIINGLLDISRLHSGTMAFEYRDLSLATAIDAALKIVAPQLNEKNIEIVVNIENDLPSIRADAEKIHSVLLNLLGNALKFSNPGTKITIAARLINGRRIRVSISDQGIGISEKYLRKIFARFFQVDSSSTRLYGGSGLGLALVKEIILAHRGRVWAESEEGVGTTIFFEMPIVSDEAVAPRVINLADKRKEVDSTTGEKYRVMIVDDDDEVIKLLKIVLARINCEIIPANSGSEALKLLMKKPVDLVLLDIGMTEMDGIEICSRIKSEPLLRRIPVYMLSAYTSAKYHEAASEAGCNGFINKPFSIDEITDLINENRNKHYGKF